MNYSKLLACLVVLPPLVTGCGPSAAEIREAVKKGQLDAIEAQRKLDQAAIGEVGFAQLIKNHEERLTNLDESEKLSAGHREELEDLKRIREETVAARTKCIGLWQGARAEQGKSTEWPPKD